MRPPSEKKIIFQARILLDRLERLSADSRYAHRASGLRGALLRSLTALRESDSRVDFTVLAGQVAQGYEILNKAAGEIPEAD